MTRIPPQLNGLLLCDRVFQQAPTGKWCVIGTHAEMAVQNLPDHRPLGVFVSLGDVEHGAQFQVTLRKPRGEKLVQAEAVVEGMPGADQRPSSLDLGWQFPLVAFDALGSYRLDVTFSGKTLASRELDVVSGEVASVWNVPGTCELQALLLCDAAFQHLGSAAWSLIGIHDVIVVRELPAQHSPFVVFWSVRAFAGDEIVMTTVRDNEGSVVYSMRAAIPPIRDSAFGMGLPFPPITFKREGSHMIELHVGEKLIAVRSFVVVVPKPDNAASR